MADLDPQIQRQNLERLLDLIADALIESNLVDVNLVNQSQKTIRNGILQSGRNNVTERLVLYQQDVEANKEDLLQTISDNDGVQTNLQTIANEVEFDLIQEILINGNGEVGGIDSIFIMGGNLPNGSLEITDLIFGEGNPLNVSQFVPIVQKETEIDVDKAEDILDTNIFELLPTGDARQSRIIRLFQEMEALLPPTLPNFDDDDDGRVDRAENGTWTGSLQYSQDNSISYAQDNPDESNIDEDDAFIHRLKNTANASNSNYTIEDIYRRVEPYLTDILEDTIELDDIPTYENQSNGYLQFRNLNQGIIIRNTNEEFVESLNPNNPTWLTSDYNGLLTQIDDDSKKTFILNNAGTGFTITMWVRFLDKTSSGTLFNFGNPTRSENPFGFKLETYIVNRDDPTRVGTDYTNFGEFVDVNGYLSDTLGLFKNTNSERFVRLQVREFGDTTSTGADNGLRDSHVGNATMRKFSWNPPELNSSNPGYDDLRLLSTTHIPQDFNEWYFICATYNPNIIEPNETEQYYESYKSNSDFWMNHINPITTEPVANSGYGNKAKVEIISRTDLLRARGFKV